VPVFSVDARGLTGSQKALMYALSGVLRSAASRAAYVAPTTFVTIAGAETRFELGTLTITDALNEIPSEAAFTIQSVRGTRPAKGQAVVITLGSRHRRARLFSGQILSVRTSYQSRPTLTAWQVLCADYTWLLNSHKVRARFQASSATVVVRALLATYAPGFAARVAAGLPVLTDLSFEDEDLTDCLTRIAGRIGGAWRVDTAGVVRFWLDTEPTIRPPRPITAAHPTFHSIAVTDDLGLMISRVFGEGGGSTALVARDAGATTIPVETGAWYATNGGDVIIGAQRVHYNACPQGGATAIVVGPGTGSAGAPAAALTPGPGQLVGTYRWAVAFANQAGETKVGASSNAVTVPAFPNPSAAPGATATGTVGRLAGVYQWLVTFVTAEGETLGGPATNLTVPAFPAPTGQVGVTQNANVGRLIGNYQYALSWVTAIGETLPGPAIGMTCTAQATPFVQTTAAGPLVGTYRYRFSYVSAYGETLGVEGNSILTANHVVTVSSIGAGPTGTLARRIYRTKAGGAQPYFLVAELAGTADGSYVDATPDAGLTVPPPLQNLNGRQVDVTIPQGPTGTIARRVYRTKTSGSTYYLLVEVPGNAVQENFLDNVVDGELRGDAAPILADSGGYAVTLSNVITGPAGTLARRVYRTIAGGAEFKLAHQLNDNTTTGLTDNLPDASLGRLAPIVSDAGGGAVDVSSIPIGGAGITQRILYRTAAGGAVLKYLATLADNTTTTFRDAVRDSSLGREALTQGTLGALPGDTALQLDDDADFPVPGWALVEDQAIYYTARQDDALRGIPATGAGAIIKPIPGGAGVVALPFLDGIPATGEGAIRWPILVGDAIHVAVTTIDNLARDTLQQWVGGDGYRDDRVQDTALSRAALEARVLAVLDYKKDRRLEVEYVTQDPSTVAGGDVFIDLLGVWEDLQLVVRIQEVTIDHIGMTRRPDVDGMPWYHVRASSHRFKFEDYLRQRNALRG
jgi:hypothetical protein